MEDILPFFWLTVGVIVFLTICCCSGVRCCESRIIQRTGGDGYELVRTGWDEYMCQRERVVVRHYDKMDVDEYHCCMRLKIM